MIWRRLRGFMGTTLAACVPWTLLGLVTGFLFQFDLIPGVHGSIGQPVLGGMVAVGALVGAVIGGTNGLALSALLLATERGKSVDDVRGRRFTAWNALATAVALGLITQSPVGAAAGGVVGAIGGLGALWLARRARQGAQIETLDHGPHISV